MRLEEIEKIHDEAMDFAESAIIAKLFTHEIRAVKLSRKAYEKERKAVELIEKHYKDLEPTRSILYLSAATLAVDCGEYDEAMRLVDIGLEGKPPIEIKGDFVDLRKQIEEKRGSNS